MSTEPKTLLTEAQYLEIERQAEFRSEFYQGEMFAMAGAGWNHGQLIMNVSGQLWSQLRSRPCRVATNDLRVRVSATGLYTYPNIVVVCGEPQFLDGPRDTLLNPALIVEVLSPSTEAYDRGRKFEHYRSIPSLKDYLLVASDRVHVDRYTLREDGEWTIHSADGLNGTIELPNVGCTLALSDLYEGVELG